MARSSNQKLKLLYLCDFLMRRTDEEHPATVAQMIDHLAQRGIPAERKSIYDDLTLLRDVMQLDLVSRREGSGMVYYIGARDFELPELKLLVDSVQASKFIPEEKSLELIEKLEKLTSEHNARSLHRQVYVRGRGKTGNRSVYYNVDDIHTAIDADRAVSFQYYDWSPDRRRVFRHDGKRYEASPWALIWDDEYYYLVAFDHEAGQLKHFRVDKLYGIRQTEHARQGEEAFRRFDLPAYSDTHFGMFSGEVRRVRLVFENALAGPVIDRFGEDTALVPYDGGNFSVTVSAAVNIQFFGWLCGFGARVRILAPDDVVDDMRAFLADISAQYAQ